QEKEPKDETKSIKGNKKVVPTNSFSSETEEEWVKSLWEEVCKANKNKDKKGKAPLKEIDLDGKQVNFNIGSRYGEIASSKAR
ncbi:hypothetical protein, partial [Escherichia coli]|uniref:hypothetical protein n=1 Tax=Escherichia coli TaxID=562 RepID=UPI00142E577F